MSLVRLRPLRPGDEEAAVRWATDPGFCLAAGWTSGLAPRVVRQHWGRIVAGSGPGFLRLGVELEERLVGYVDLAGLCATTAEWGIGIGERARWGQGLGRQAGRLMLAHAFGTLELETVTAQVHTPNGRSHALVRRLGFYEIGPGTPDLFCGEVVPVVRYVQTRTEWLGGPDGLA